MSNKEQELGTPGIVGTQGCGVGGTYGKYGGIGDYHGEPKKFGTIQIHQAIQTTQTAGDIDYLKREITEKIAEEIQNHITFEVNSYDNHPYNRSTEISGKLTIVPEGTKTGIVYDVGVEIEGEQFTRDEVLEAVVQAFPERFI